MKFQVWLKKLNNKNYHKLKWEAMLVIKIPVYNKNQKNYPRFFWQSIIYMNWYRVMNKNSFKKHKRTMFKKKQLILRRKLKKKLM